MGGDLFGSCFFVLCVGENGQQGSRISHVCRHFLVTASWEEKLVVDGDVRCIAKLWLEHRHAVLFFDWIVCTASLWMGDDV